MIDSIARDNDKNCFSNDLLKGADAIAGFIFGENGKRRQVYHLVETSRLPIFRLGSTLCARRSVLLRWIVDQENRGWPSVRN